MEKILLWVSPIKLMQTTRLSIIGLTPFWYFYDIRTKGVSLFWHFYMQKNDVDIDPKKCINNRFLNTLDTTHSDIHQQQTGWKESPNLMVYLSTNFETRCLLNPAQITAKTNFFYFHPHLASRLHLVCL